MYYLIEWTGFGWTVKQSFELEEDALKQIKQYQRVVNETMIHHLPDMKPPMVMSRKYLNKEILKRLESIIETNPDLRFMQILTGCNIGDDNFYDESSETLRMIDTTIKSGWFDAT